MQSRSIFLVMGITTLVTVLVVCARSVAVAQAEGGAQSASASQKADTAPAGNAKNGKSVYTAYGCYECHGREAQGGAGTGPKLGHRRFRTRYLPSKSAR